MNSNRRNNANAQNNNQNAQNNNLNALNNNLPADNQNENEIDPQVFVIAENEEIEIADSSEDLNADSGSEIAPINNGVINHGEDNVVIDEIPHLPGARNEKPRAIQLDESEDESEDIHKWCNRRTRLFLDTIARMEEDRRSLEKRKKELKKEIKELKMKMMKMRESVMQKKGPLCKICVENEINSVFFPCRHAFCCVSCGKQWLRQRNICPCCKAKATMLKEIIL